MFINHFKKTVPLNYFVSIKQREEEETFYKNTMLAPTTNPAYVHFGKTHDNFASWTVNEGRNALGPFDHAMLMTG